MWYYWIDNWNKLDILIVVSGYPGFFTDSANLSVQVNNRNQKSDVFQPRMRARACRFMERRLRLQPAWAPNPLLCALAPE
jgi:hypothetical protein